MPSNIFEFLMEKCNLVRLASAAVGWMFGAYGLTMRSHGVSHNILKNLVYLKCNLIFSEK